METYVNFCSFKNSIKQVCPILAMILLQINQVYSQSPTFNWVQTFGGANSDEGKSLVVDESGNIYMVGNYSDKLALNINGGDVEINSLGDDDIFIAKLNKDNNLLWVKTIGGSHKDSGNDIFLDKNGNIYIVGEFSGTVDFDPNSSVTTKISRGLKDVFILKLNSQGDYQWVYQIGGNNEAEGKALNIDEYGNILVIGNFQSNLLFNEVFQNNLISNGNKDIFIIKIDINGNLIWANSYGGIGDDSGLDTHIDSENEIILTGYFSNNMILPLNGILNLTSDGGFDIFVIKINNFGDLLWAKKIGGIGNDIGYSVVSNDENDILITGGFENTVNFDPIATNFSLTSNGLSDIFYLKCNSAGNFNFVKSIGSTFNDYGNSITIDNNGNSFITGLKSGSFSISEGGGGTGTPQTNSFIAMFNVEGELIWNKSLGNFISPILGNSIKLDKFGNILLTGLFRRTVNFSPTNTIRNYSSFNFSRDAFLLSWNYSNTCIGASISTQPLSIGSIVNGTATFNIATSGTPPYTYQWRKNGIDIPNATNSSYTTPPLELSDNGSSYTCFVTNCNGTNNVISNSAILTVSNNCIPVSITSSPSNQTAIVGNTATFSVSTTGTPPFTYQWRKNGIDIPNATNASYTTPPLTLSDNGGNFTCFVTNCNGTINVTSNIGLLTVNNIVPTINSLICTNRIINNKKFETDHTFYKNDLPSSSNNAPIKVCADGSSASFFKVNVSNPNGIGFRILEGNKQVVNGTNSDDISKYGKFSQPLTFNGNFVEVNYTHPDHVIEGLYLNLTLVVTFNNEPIHNLEFPLHIYRAPIVFVHGFAGDKTTFEDMEHFLVDNQFYPSGFIFIHESPLIHRVDYFNESLQHFHSNRNVVPKGIDHVLLTSRYHNISAGKVTLIAHSMGGILSRLYLQDAYRVPNIMPGYRDDIYKLITLNTPHYGTQFANWGVNNSTLKKAIITLYDILDFSGIFDKPNIDSEGAILDMQVRSFAILNNLNIPPNKQNKVPSVTLSSDERGALEDKGIKFIKKILGSNFPKIYDYQENDLIVPTFSQRGGLNGPISFQKQWHVGSARNQQLIEYVTYLIKIQPEQAIFTKTGFPQGILSPPLLKNNFPSSEFKRKQLPDSIKIISPNDSQVFTATQNVEVEIFAQGDISHMTLVIYGVGFEPIIIDTSAVNKLFFQIPLNAIGNIKIFLIGGNENEWLKSDLISIFVSTNYPFDSLEVSPDTIRLPLGTYYTVALKGYFTNLSSGVNLTGAPGLTIQYNSDILNSINQSTFYGKQIGSSNVNFTYQGKTTSVYINVVDDPSVLTASFNYSKDNICTNSHVIFGDESKGMATSYQWTFPGGTPSTSTEKNPKVFYSQPGIYSVKLKTFFVNGVDSFQLDNLITVGSLGQAVITPSGLVTLCQGSSITLTASPADFYLWNNGATTKSITISNAGDYLVTLTNNAGCSSVSAITQVIIQPAPTIQSSNITFSSVSSNNMTLNWNNGNGTNRIVVAKANSPITGVPIDGQYYYANSNFGNGSILGPDEFVVYNGAGSNVTVRNLSRGE